jgi:outer membrane biosynthesis protein TonB
MRIGLTISTVLHAVVLSWGLITFAPRPFEAQATDSVPVDIISSTEFSQMVAGSRTAPKAPVPKPLVDKVGEAKPADNPAPKVVEKPEIVATAAKEAPPPEPKPEPKREPERKQTAPKVDPIAEALKKDEAKPEPKKEEARIPTPPHRPDPPKPQPKFDATRIAALLDKRDPQRQAALGEMINHTPTLGSPKGSAPMLSQSEIDALRAQIRRCWNPPAGAADAQDLRVELNVKLRIDGSLAAEPVLLDRGGSPYFQVFAESALRAVQRCQPYNLPAAKYEVWKDIDLGFRLDDLYGG